jgi:uroporphyrinogen-III decarboxylase
MLQTHNHLFLKAIKNEPIERTPIWIMRLQHSVPF